MRSPRAHRLLLASLMFAAGCNEWVPLAPEPEVYPLETALRICRDYAERGGERGPVFPEPRQRVDPGVYDSLLNRCMRAQGWVLRRKHAAEKPAAGASGTVVPP